MPNTKTVGPKHLMRRKDQKYKCRISSDPAQLFVCVLLCLSRSLIVSNQLCIFVPQKEVLSILIVSLRFDLDVLVLLHLFELIFVFVLDFVLNIDFH